MYAAAATFFRTYPATAATTRCNNAND